VDALLGAVRACAEDDTLDDPLADVEQVDEQLQRLPAVFRYRYEPLAAFLAARMDPLLAQYQQVAAGGGAAVASAAGAAAVAVLENELAWCVAVCGAVVGGQTWAANVVAGHEALDGQLAKRCFACAQMASFRAEASQGGACCTDRLELALLGFLGQFRKVYLADALLPSSPASEARPSSASQTLQALGTPLSALAWDAEHGDGDRGPLTVKQRATRSMLAAMEQVWGRAFLRKVALCRLGVCVVGGDRMRPWP
jgi:hypothetical protein